MIASTVIITDVFMPYSPGIEESGVLLVRSRPCIEITPLSSFQEGLGLLCSPGRHNYNRCPAMQSK
jgi:hypothetical protein